MPPSRATRLRVAERRTKAIQLRAAGTSWETIAGELGYASRGAACNDVARALDQRLKEQNDQTEHLRAIELERLDAVEREVWDVLRRRHVLVSGGKVVRDDSVDDGQPLEDDGPTLAAVDRLVKIGERRAKLQGIDAPVKVDQGGTLRYEILGVPPDAHR